MATYIDDNGKKIRYKLKVSYPELVEMFLENKPTYNNDINSDNNVASIYYKGFGYNNSKEEQDTAIINTFHGRSETTGCIYKYTSKTGFTAIFRDTRLYKGRRRNYNPCLDRKYPEFYIYPLLTDSHPYPDRPEFLEKLPILALQYYIKEIYLNVRLNTILNNRSFTKTESLFNVNFIILDYVQKIIKLIYHFQISQEAFEKVLNNIYNKFKNPDYINYYKKHYLGNKVHNQIKLRYVNYSLADLTNYILNCIFKKDALRYYFVSPDLNLLNKGCTDNLLKIKTEFIKIKEIFAFNFENSPIKLDKDGDILLKLKSEQISDNVLIFNVYRYLIINNYCFNTGKKYTKLRKSLNLSF